MEGETTASQALASTDLEMTPVNHGQANGIEDEDGVSTVPQELNADQNANLGLPGDMSNDHDSDNNSASDHDSGNDQSVEPVEVDPKLVTDELLCYVYFYLQSCAPENIKKVVLDFFTQEEILNSKKELWNEHRDRLKPFVNRKTSPSRNCSEANVLDILEAFADLDKFEGAQRVTYVAANLAKMPSLHPEDINPVSTIRRVSNMEQKCNMLINNFSESQILMDTLKETLESLRDKVNTHDQLIESVAHL